jgi:hypothetical protein
MTTTSGGKYGTALQAAAHIGDAAKVQLLLEYKAGPNIVGEFIYFLKPQN